MYYAQRSTLAELMFDRKEPLTTLVMQIIISVSLGIMVIKLFSSGQIEKSAIFVSVAVARPPPSPLNGTQL